MQTMSKPAPHRHVSSSRKLVGELHGIRVALEAIQLSFQQWLALQGQPRCAVDDRLSNAIEHFAASPLIGRRTSATGAE
jgi:hypothetical protein